MTSTLHKIPAMGVYDRPYWDYAQKDELRLQQCTGCGAFRYPPGPVCPRCLSDQHEWQQLSGRGRLVTWAVFHRQYLPQFEPPYIVASVEAEEGPLLIGQLHNADRDQISIGMPVRAFFQTVETEAGPWRICQWQPDPQPIKPLNQGDSP